jgi:hypothetical protein
MKASAVSSKKRQTGPLGHGEGLSRVPRGAFILTLDSSGFTTESEGAGR